MCAEMLLLAYLRLVWVGVVPERGGASIAMGGRVRLPWLEHTGLHGVEVAVAGPDGSHPAHKHVRTHRTRAVPPSTSWPGAADAFWTETPRLGSDDRRPTASAEPLARSDIARQPAMMWPDGSWRGQ